MAKEITEEMAALMVSLREMKPEIGEHTHGTREPGGRAGFANQDLVNAGGKPTYGEPDGLPPSATYPVAYHSVTYRLRYRNGELRGLCHLYYIAYSGAPARPGVSPSVQAFEVGAPGEGVSAQALLALGRGLNHQTLATFGAAALKHDAAVLGAHPLPEAVVVEFLAIGRLKGPFHASALVIMPPLAQRQAHMLSPGRAKVKLFDRASGGQGHG